MTLSKPSFLGLFALLLMLQSNFLLITSAARVNKELECTMCSDCENPCQPSQFLPPPPPSTPPPVPTLPPPLPQTTLECPPPPLPPTLPPPLPPATPERPPSQLVPPCNECPLPLPPPSPPECNECEPGPGGSSPQPRYPPQWLSPPGFMGGGSIYGPPNNYFPGYDKIPPPSSAVSGSLSLTQIAFTIFIFLVSVTFCY